MRAPESCPVVALRCLSVCLFAALCFVGCSQSDHQRAKDDADRKAIVGDWERVNSAGVPDGMGITRFFPDGTYWQSNKIYPNPTFDSIRGFPVRDSRVLDGQWSITNGELMITFVISWDGNKDPQIHVNHAKIVRITDQELVRAVARVRDGETNGYATNILRRAK